MYFSKLNLKFNCFIICFSVCDARKVKATGRGLQKNGVRVKDVADFKVFTENAGDGQLDIKVIGPGLNIYHFVSNC